MFHPWETFFLLTGSSAGALIGVMFIVTTLTGNITADQARHGTKTYLNPVVFHLGAILTASALALVPDGLITVMALVMFGIAVLGFVYSLVTLRRTFEKTAAYEPTVWDQLFFGILPALLYVLTAIGAAAVLWLPDDAGVTIGAAMLLLLLLCVRNAWDVATFAVRATQPASEPAARK